ASARSASGYRLYDVEAVARLDLVRTLRDLGLPLESIRALLNAQTSLPEVAAAHLKALDHQIQTLRLRRAVLRAAAKTNTTPEEVALMHRLAKMSEVERQHLINDFLDDTVGGTNANPELIAMLRAMRPELPDDPEPHQVQAWVELAELVQNPDFRASVRRMAEYQAAEPHAGDRTGLHHAPRACRPGAGGPCPPRWHRPRRQHGRTHPQRPRRALRRDVPVHRHPQLPQRLASSAGDRQRSANRALPQLAPRHQRLADPALPVPDLRLVHPRSAFAREQLITERLDQEGCALRRQPYENASP